MRDRWGKTKTFSNWQEIIHMLRGGKEKTVETERRRMVEEGRLKDLGMSHNDEEEISHR